MFSGSRGEGKEPLHSCSTRWEEEGENPAIEKRRKGRGKGLLLRMRELA